MVEGVDLLLLELHNTDETAVVADVQYPFCLILRRKSQGQDFVRETLAIAREFF